MSDRSEAVQDGFAGIVRCDYCRTSQHTQTVYLLEIDDDLGNIQRHHGTQVCVTCWIRQVASEIACVGRRNDCQWTFEEHSVNNSVVRAHYGRKSLPGSQSFPSRVTGVHWSAPLSGVWNSNGGTVQPRVLPAFSPP